MVGRIRLDGYDGNFMHFSCPSYTTPGLVYTLVLDKAEWKVTCDCMDAVCRKKVWHLLESEPVMCKHLKSLQLFVLPLLKKTGAL